MKKTKNWWVWIGLGLLAIFIAFNLNSREQFTTLNPIPTKADIQSLNTDNLTPTAQKLVDWFEKNAIWGSKDAKPTDKKGVKMFIYQNLNFVSDEQITKGSLLISTYRNKPTPKQFVDDVMSQVFGMSNVGEHFVKMIEGGSTLDMFNTGDTEINVFYLGYTYLFGPPESDKKTTTPPATTTTTTTTNPNTPKPTPPTLPQVQPASTPSNVPWLRFEYLYKR